MEGIELPDSCLSSLYIHQKYQSLNLLHLMYDPVVSLMCLTGPRRNSKRNAGVIYRGISLKTIFFNHVQINIIIQTSGRSTLLKQI